ncbi:bifunctional tetrahydrofolate synthase/dihydrofolate synthase [Alcaligenaceae bacterium]|nr:bifunctional tetrahydrofolate synthase/dihydrofolate synthase [Alcaligenaceae bacterium]
MSRLVPSNTATLQDWLGYLETLHRTPIDLGLDRIRAVADKLDLKFPFVKITVAGTNGKGSTCAMLEAILLAAGYKVGLYTSPHLVDFNERIRLSGELASNEQIIQQFQHIEAIRGDVSLSYFEYTTLAALMLFEGHKLDVVVLEVGLGGRLDAVNLVDTDCAIITSIDIDHTEYLGDTREKIGWEKAHIFRAGRPAICVDPVPPQSVIDYAAEIGAELRLFGKDFNYSGDRQQWAYGGRSQRRSGLAYPALRGANQLLNATAALAAIEALHPKLAVPQQAVRIGLAQVSLPGRLQILPGTPSIILDVAHNPHAAAALGQNLDSMGYFPHTHAVVGMLQDKDVAGVVAKLATRVDRWYCAGVEGPRGMSGEDLAQIVRQVVQSSAAKDTFEQNSREVTRLVSKAEPGATHRPGVRPVAPTPPSANDVTVTCFNDPVLAFTAAQKQAGENDRILVFGSFSTVGPVLNELGRKVI